MRETAIIMRARFFVQLSILMIAALELSSQTKVQQSLLRQSDVASTQVSTNPRMIEDVRQESRKSVTLAVVLSAILPGAGELYAGNFESGKYSLIAEAGIWLTYGGFQTHGNWVRQDARLFAAQHAHANLNSKDDKFDVDIGNFISQSEYNDARLRNREYDLMYTDPSYNWHWDSDNNRSQFKNERIRSDEIYQNARFVLIAAVVNRVFSAFSSGRAVSANNRRILMDGSWNMEVIPTLQANGFDVRLSTSF
jgi:hypothetical protein